MHAEEEAQGTRLGIDSLTCLLANEADPSRLSAMSPGKLTRFLVPEGAHVEPDQPYAEVEVRLEILRGGSQRGMISYFAILALISPAMPFTSSPWASPPAS